MSRDVSPGRSRTPSPRYQDSSISLFEKLDKLADEITNDIQSSPRSQLASKLDANVKNTQLIITTMREKMQSIATIQSEDRVTLATILNEQDKMKIVLEAIYTEVCQINDRIQEMDGDGSENK